MLESFTVTVNTDCPPADPVGVPEMTPVVPFKFRPAGREPAVVVYEKGGVPPVS